MWTFQEQLSQSDEANSVKKRARKKIQEYVKRQQLKPHMQQAIKDSKGSKSPGKRSRVYASMAGGVTPARSVAEPGCVGTAGGDTHARHVTEV